MASSTFHTIAVQGAAVRREAIAHEAITPGSLLTINTDEEVALHASAGGVLPGKLIALESPTAAAGTTEAIDVDYASGDVVYYAEGQPGDVYNMRLKIGESAVKGVTQFESSSVAGLLSAKTIDANVLVNAIVGVADEDVTGGAAVMRCRVRII